MLTPLQALRRASCAAKMSGCAFRILRTSRLSLRHSIDRKSTRLNSSHTEIYTLSLHDALPIYADAFASLAARVLRGQNVRLRFQNFAHVQAQPAPLDRSEEHTSELQSHRDLHSFPTRRSSDLC